MTEPSPYELEAWHRAQAYRGRPLSRAVRASGQKVAEGAAAVGKRASKAVASRPRLKVTVDKAQGAARAVGAEARKLMPELPEWSHTAVGSVQRSAARVSRAGLSPKRIVKRHQKKGHEVERLSDLRHLDLEQIDEVHGRALTWWYPGLASLSGAGAGFVISGGEIVITASAGAAAAPSLGAVAGAFAGDAAIVLALASRCVGDIALLHGYDPEDPAERIFIFSVINAGTAMSASAKTAAFADISRLTQALVRGKTWEVLNRSVVSRVATQFAGRFSLRLTKQGLGRIVPLVGIVLGGGFNWATLEAIVDAADVAYRRRFLLEKYPQFADDKPLVFTDSAPEDADSEISILDELADAGGPDLREPESEEDDDEVAGE
jgi:hypothetical protein